MAADIFLKDTDVELVGNLVVPGNMNVTGNVHVATAPGVYFQLTPEGVQAHHNALNAIRFGNDGLKILAKAAFAHGSGVDDSGVDFLTVQIDKALALKDITANDIKPGTLSLDANGATLRYDPNTLRIGSEGVAIDAASISLSHGDASVKVNHNGTRLQDGSAEIILQRNVAAVMRFGTSQVFLVGGAAELSTDSELKLQSSAVTIQSAHAAKTAQLSVKESTIALGHAETIVLDANAININGVTSIVGAHLRVQISAWGPPPPGAKPVPVRVEPGPQPVRTQSEKTLEDMYIELSLRIFAIEEHLKLSHPPGSVYPPPVTVAT